MTGVMLTVGIDEVGYGPKLGPLVVAAALARKPLRARVRIADSKKVFSQATGVRTLEPAVLGFLGAGSFRELLDRLGTPFPDAPWYRDALELPLTEPLEGLEGARARFVDPAEFNASTRERNKSDFLFEIAADLIRNIRGAHPEATRFVVGKHGGRHFYLRGIQERISPTVMVIEESPRRSAYSIPGATIEFLEGAEDRHELVALASMMGKYVRECAMRLFNDFWSRHREGLRRTAGYGADAARFFQEIEPELRRLRMDRDAVLRLR
jgi:ribonuclease HII